MRRAIVLLGALTLGSGAGMYLMLGQLRSDFFRAFLPPWVYVSYGLIGLGSLVVVAGVAMKESEEGKLGGRAASAIFARLALVNTVAAAVLVAPVLYPTLRLPILITQWPGIFMVLAYFSFVVVGVLGMAVWSLLFLHLPDVFGKEGVGRVGLVTQLVVTEVGIYGLAIAMFLGGWVGSWLAYTGAGPVAIGVQMEFSVIPSGVAIFAVAAGTVLGVLNVVFSGRSVAS